MASYSAFAVSPTPFPSYTSLQYKHMQTANTWFHAFSFHSIIGTKFSGFSSPSSISTVGIKHYKWGSTKQYRKSIELLNFKKESYTLHHKRPKIWSILIDYESKARTEKRAIGERQLKFIKLFRFYVLRITVS